MRALPLPGGVGSLRGLRYLLIPGLLTKWYPLYMCHMQAGMRRLELHSSFSKVRAEPSRAEHGMA